MVTVGISNTSSIIANMMLLLPRYHHNMVLTVLCLSGIVMVLILATFDAYNSILRYWIDYSHIKFYSTTPCLAKYLRFWDIVLRLVFQHGACTIKPFTTEMYAPALSARVFCLWNFCLILKFARALSRSWKSRYTGFHHNYKARLEVFASNKHSSLLRFCVFLQRLQFL